MSARPRKRRGKVIIRHGLPQINNAGNMNQASSGDNSREIKTERFRLTHPSVASQDVEVVYTNDVSEAENWLREHITACAARIVGFDIEWKPESDRGTENQPAVLQLGVKTSCLVLHICHMSELPRSLISILGDETILKVGVGIKEDASKLTRHRELVCEGMIDIQKMLQTTDGLKTLAKHFLGIELEKDKSVTTSDWEIYFPLSSRQIEYAALDAWAGVKIYHAIVQDQQGTSAQYNEALSGSVNDHPTTSLQSPRPGCSKAD